MGTGYTRADTGNNIADGNIINAADLDGEFDALQTAFNETTGHTHDGTSAEGAPITFTGPAQEYVSTGTELRPKTNNTYDLGSATNQWKDLYVDGIANIDSLVADTADINGGTIDATVVGGTTPAAGTFTSLTATGNITVSGTVDGRDVATDGSKLDGIEAGADVTDTTNVTAAGALMDSELTNIAAVKALNQGVATTDTPTFAGITATTADINGGTIDGVTIGGAVAGAITGTTGTFSNTFAVDTNTLFVDTVNNRVGIGTSAPSSKLEVNGTITSTAEGNQLLLKYGTASNPTVIHRDDGANYYILLSAAGTTPNPSFNTLRPFYINLTSGLLYSSNGQSFSGNTTVNDTLVIDDTIQHKGDTDTRIRFPLDNTVTVETGGSERMRINSSGYVGIGTSAPETKLHLQGGAFKLNDDFILQGSSNTVYADIQNEDGAFVTRYQVAGGGGTAEATRVSSVGDFSVGTDALFVDRANKKVGIGTSSPTNTLDVSGDSVRVRTAQTPATASASGNQGEIAWDANYIYVCTATNTWKRAALSTW